MKDLVKRVKAAGMQAVAVTDHGNMFGAITFYKAAKEASVHAILGCELDGASPRQRRRATTCRCRHTLEGYKNLVWLVSRGHVAPDRARPRRTAVTLDDVAARRKGLVAMTGCMGGLVSQAILEEGAGPGRGCSRG